MNQQKAFWLIDNTWDLINDLEPYIPNTFNPSTTKRIKAGLEQLLMMIDQKVIRFPKED